MSWPLVALGEIFEIARGGSPRPIDNYLTDNDDGVNWVSISDASESSKHIARTKRKIKPEGVKRSRQVSPGELLLTNSMSFGRPYIMATHGCIHDGWLVLGGAKRPYDPDYFYHLLGSSNVYSEFSRLAAGATVKNLNIELVESVHVPLPPLDEQQRIAAILDQADDLRRKRRAALEQLGSAAASSIDIAFTNPMRFSGLSDICDIQGGLQLTSSRSALAIEVSYLRVANVYRDELSLEEIKKLKITQSELNRTSLLSGDILFVEGHGNPEEIGRCAVWDGSIEPCVHQNHLIRARVIDPIVDATILSCYLNSKTGRKKLLQRGKTTSGLNTISVSDVKSVSVPVLDNRCRLSLTRTLAEINNLKASHRAHLFKLDALFASLQHRAFCGEL